MTINNGVEVTEIICSTNKRKRWTGVEKRQIVNETYQGRSISRILPENMVYLLTNYSLSVNIGRSIGGRFRKKVVPLSQVKELETDQQKLERILGKKTLEVEI